MNKNDLRFKKTETAIKNAYVSLKKNNIKPLKVTELCEKAMINKTTFYLHYETMDALKKQVCLEYVSEILKNCPHINEIFTDTKAFVNSIYTVFLQEEKIIFKLYENDVNALVNDVEKELFKTYINKDMSKDTEIAIRFCVGGAFRLLIFNKDAEDLSITIKLIENFIESLSL